MGQAAVEYQPAEFTHHVFERQLAPGTKTIQRCLNAGHEQGRRDAFAGYVAEGEVESAIRPLPVVVVISAHRLRRGAVDRKIQAGYPGRVLRKEVALNLARDFEFALLLPGQFGFPLCPLGLNGSS